MRSGRCLAGRANGRLAARQYVDPQRAKIILIDAGPTILAGSSPGLIDKANSILRDLGVDVRTNSMIARVTFSRVPRRCSIDSCNQVAAWILRFRYSLVLGSPPFSL